MDGDESMLDSGFEGMAEHPSLEHVRLRDKGREYEGREYYMDDGMEDMKALLIACPALCVLDFTDYTSALDKKYHLIDDHQPSSKTVRGMVAHNTHGAARLTHAFFQHSNMFQGHIFHNNVANVLDNTWWSELVGD
mmetsp:Transcript_32085/g.79306  ORF Transcript_32085/g.79306 Transcript_32085/m.79306 type:complete len:136 (-) Transcript_32085:53-460(-)